MELQSVIDPDPEFTSIQFLLRRDAQQQEELAALRTKIEELETGFRRVEKTMPRGQTENGETSLGAQIFDLLRAKVSNQFVFSIASIAALMATLNFVEIDRLQQAIDLWQQINSTSNR